MNQLTRALSKREKIIVLVVMAVILVLFGLTRPLWSSEYRGSQPAEAAASPGAETTEDAP
ncbi:hypothetical protein [Lachnoclostridium sp. Marseille-P6806]|uniref:hypothetical protein n=1 Tax=Lachnoclostridium sp. Marseille-P6806 TaxID=2364793 RepID=UPI0010315991|nr:hypothetical protein [Lachnoclostridium sp. Marseille-P6806]